MTVALAAANTSAPIAEGKGGVLRRATAVRGTGDAPSPWTRTDLLRSGGLAGAGALGLLISSLGTSFSKSYDRQLLWTALALIALAVATLGGVVLLLVGLRSVRLLRRDLLLAVAGRTGATDDLPLVEAEDDVCWTSAMSRYHRSSCLFVRGKECATADRRAAHTAGLSPCEACSP